MSEGVGGGGEFRHCCRKQWRFSADNYFTRELTGKFNLDQLNWGMVAEEHYVLALSHLEKFDVIMLTEVSQRGAGGGSGVLQSSARSP